MKNIEIQNKIRESGKKHWQIAACIGISEATLVRWLREEEMVPEHKRMILDELEKSEKNDSYERKTSTNSAVLMSRKEKTVTKEIERILDNLSNIDCMEQADAAETAFEARQLILHLVSELEKRG